MSRVALIDHGLGNIQAVEKALSKVSASGPVFRCHDPAELERADCIVLPGTGQLSACVNELQRLGLAEMLGEYARQKPVLAINLGLLALCRNGLQLVPVDVVPLNENGEHDIRLPHIGWNHVHRKIPHLLFEGIPQDGQFYFAHRNRVQADTDEVVAECEYGERFPAMIRHDLLIGVQFHPEISHRHGLRFLANFVNWDGKD